MSRRGRCCCACAMTMTLPSCTRCRPTAELAQINYDRDRKQFLIHAVSPGDAGQRRCEPEERPGPGGAAAGDRGPEGVARAVRRASGHSRGRSGSVPDGGDGGRDVAGARSALCRFLSAAAGAGEPQGGAGRGAAGRYVAWARRSAARSARSIRRSIPALATCRSARRCPIRTIDCCLACSPRSRSIPVRHSASITLPQTAIAYNPYGNTVYLVLRQGQERAGPSRT